MLLYARITEQLILLLAATTLDLVKTPKGGISMGLMMLRISSSTTTMNFAIASSANGVGKHNGRDNTCVAVEAGKGKGLAAERGCRPVISSSELTRPTASRTKQRESHRCLRHPYTPSSFAPQHPDEAARIPPLSSLFPPCELIRTVARRRRR